MDLHWRKSRRCGGPDLCVEVAWDPDGVWVRDSKHPDGPVLRFTWAEWQTFVAGVKDGEFDGTAVPAR